MSSRAVKVLTVSIVTLGVLIAGTVTANTVPVGTEPVAPLNRSSVVPSDAGIIAAYSLTAPLGMTRSGLVARAVVPMGNPCPLLRTTHAQGVNKRTAMIERVAPATTNGAFASLRSCSAKIPFGALGATVGGRTIAASMPKETDRIAVFGDTGCRLKESTVQDCNTAESWPLAQLSRSVAAERPQLIVFTGDFFYREAACGPSNTAECAGSPAPGAGLPFKDTALGWQADVFTPMASVLGAAPIVVVRGNHESCARGGNGYYIYFDPRDGTEGTCAPQLSSSGVLVNPAEILNESFAVDIDVRGQKDLRLVVVDSAYGFDCEVSPIQPQQVAAYQAAERLAARADQSWLLVHEPVIGWQVNDDCAPTGGWVSADQQVASYGLLDDYSVIISSHVHLAQVMNIPGVPPQVVLGNGGTLLEPATPFTLPTSGPDFAPGTAYGAPTSGWWDVRYGYALVRPRANGNWLWQMKTPDATLFRNCVLGSGTMKCDAP
jgi:hypothetical protein